MNNKRQAGVHLLPVLTGGFTLLILLLIASAYVGIEAMWSTESGAARLVEEQRARLRLIEDVQRDHQMDEHVFWLRIEGSSGDYMLAGREGEFLMPWLRACCACGWASERHFTIDDNARWDWQQQHIAPLFIEGQSVAPLVRLN